MARKPAKFSPGLLLLSVIAVVVLLLIFFLTVWKPAFMKTALQRVPEAAVLAEPLHQIMSSPSGGSVIKEAAFDIELPAPDMSTAADPLIPITIDVDKNSRDNIDEIDRRLVALTEHDDPNDVLKDERLYYSFNESAPMELSKLRERLATIAKADANTTIIIKCDPNVKYCKLIRVLDLCSELGLNSRQLVCKVKPFVSDASIFKRGGPPLLADAPNGRPVVKQDPHTITIDLRMDGSMTIGGRVVTDDELRVLIEDVKRSSPDPLSTTFAIRADRAIQFHFVARTLDVVTKTGLYKISLVGIME